MEAKDGFFHGSLRFNSYKSRRKSDLSAKQTSVFTNFDASNIGAVLRPPRNIAKKI
jgi:hypothetical protein